MAEARQLLSVGIDVGTTTTQVVFSRLTVRDSARLGVVPRLEVDTTAIIYVGPAHFTPLTSPAEIDVDRLAAVVAAEYAAAGIDRSMVETGAVIITGETARAANADAILANLADFAGEFVVSVAGPNLEAQIAGRGSGAAAWSAERFTQVTNVDIGGGTSNAAVFRMGHHRSSAAVAVGGRQVRLDAATGAVTAIAPPGEQIIAAERLPIRVGERADLGALRRFCDVMADLIVDLAEGVERGLGLALKLAGPLRETDSSTAVLLSGGIGRCYYEDPPVTDLAGAAAFGDVGPLLADSLRRNERLRRLRVVRPPETLNATVLGAATQTITLSGSTIWAEEELLPLRNLPVVEPDLTVRGDVESLASAIRQAVERWDGGGDAPVALSLEIPPAMGYEALTSIAEGMAAYAQRDLGPGRPMVVVTRRDYAQVLGMTVKGLRPELPLVVIDQVGLGEGDYIDIGAPIMGGRVVPLSVKSLVFYR